MKKQDFRISIEIVWMLAFGNILITVLAAFAKIQGWEISQIMLMTSLILFFSTWIIVISDIAKNTIYNKVFWVMSMFILPTVSPLIYLIQRNKLIRLGNRLEN